MSSAPLKTMAERDVPPAKKTRLEKSQLQTLIEKFHLYDGRSRFCFAYINNLCNDKNTGLVSLKITNCDADVERPFSRALCRTERILCNEEPQSKSGYKNGLYPIGIFFRKGVEILNGLTGDKMYMPEDPEIVALLEPLLTYIFDESNSKVWHGSLDIIMDSCDIGIGLAQEESHSPGGQAPVEEHVRSRLKKVLIRDKALSQAITFSFLQRQRQKSAEHFLCPFILVSNKCVQFFFNDAENDILIQSPSSTFLVLDPTNKKLVLNYNTIISTWLVLNYKYLCSGPPAYVLKSEKAGFFQKAGEELEVYRTQLKFQNVETELPNSELFETKNAIASGLCEDVPFEWPRGDFPPRPK